MNKIIFAAVAESKDERANRCLEIFVQTDGEVTIIPPHGGMVPGVGLRVFIEQPITPLKTIFKISKDDGDGVRFAAEQAVKYIGCGGKSEAILCALGDLLVSYINLQCADGKDYSPVVKMVMADVEKNISNVTYSLEDALKKLPLNYDYIRKLFKKETGATPHEYLISERMRLASSLISSGVSNRYSEYTVSQIAASCGFSEPLYFSRVFKKYYGVAPSEYGKNLK